MENTASAMASMEKLDHSNQAFPVSEFIDEYDASSGGIYPSHWHREMELQIILAGSARYTVNGETYVVKEGNALFKFSHPAEFILYKTSTIEFERAVGSDTVKSAAGVVITLKSVTS